jgi:hypothetical protein
MKPALNRRLLVVLLALILMPGLFQVTGECQSGKPSSGDLYRYQRLKGRQLTLFDQWAAEHNERNGTSLHPATVYSSLATSQRSTFEGITHALLRSRITDSQHPMRRNALDLVSSVDQIAGRVSGVGGDKQYRLYVRLVPEAQEVLSQTRSFFRDKDNTVFHKDYPTNFRQRGREPTLQISMSKDSVRADIDVDYRSSKVPQALINGHLKAANSDVRAGSNYFGHVKRWFGLIRWWLIGRDPDEEPEAVSARRATKEAAAQAAAPPATAPTPVPQFTPEQVADAESVARATNEFLTLWLIRRDRRRAEDFLTRRPVVCANLDNDRENETATGLMAIREFKLLLDIGLRAEGRRRTLTEAVNAIEPWDTEMVFVTHTYEQLFALRAISREDAAAYMCESSRLTGDAHAYGDFYLTIFGLKLAKEHGGGLELLWTREAGRWQIVSYDVLDP